MAGRKGEKHWRDALMLAVHRIREGKDQRPILAELADKCVEMALDGDMQAIKEIGDRLDGKAPQAIIGDNENPVGIQMIERVIVDAAKATD